MLFRLKAAFGILALSSFLYFQGKSFSQEFIKSEQQVKNEVQSSTNSAPIEAYDSTHPFSRTLIERLDVNSERILSKHIDNEIDHLLRQQGSTNRFKNYEDITKSLRSSIVRSFKQTAREYALEEMGIGTWLENLLFTRKVKETKYLGSFLTDSLSGREEEHLVPSPFHNDEGYYNVRDFDPELGFNYGLRPLRENPFVFATYGTKKYEAHLRLKLESWYTEPKGEFILGAPIKNTGWIASGGVKARWNSDDSSYEGNVHIGASKKFYDKLGREKSNVRINAGLNNNAHLRTTISYGLSFK